MQGEADAKRRTGEEIDAEIAKVKEELEAIRGAHKEKLWTMGNYRKKV